MKSRDLRLGCNRYPQGRDRAADGSPVGASLGAAEVSPGSTTATGTCGCTTL